MWKPTTGVARSGLIWRQQMGRSPIVWAPLLQQNEPIYARYAIFAEGSRRAATGPPIGRPPMHRGLTGRLLMRGLHWCDGYQKRLAAVEAEMHLMKDLMRRPERVIGKT